MRARRLPGSGKVGADLDSSMLSIPLWGRVARSGAGVCGMPGWGVTRAQLRPCQNPHVNFGNPGTSAGAWLSSFTGRQDLEPRELRFDWLARGGVS